MRKALVCAMAVALVCCGAALYAQDGMGQGGGMAAAHRMQSPELKLQHMTRQLDLTPEQQQKIKPILEQESQQMASLHQDNTLSQQDRRNKFQQIRQNTDEQIKPILTPAQQEKYEMMESSRTEHGMGHGGGMGQSQPQQAPAQPAPPQQ